MNKKLQQRLDRVEKALDRLAKGGPGSGNFNHGGRPGTIGGSGGGGSAVAGKAFQATSEATRLSSRLIGDNNKDIRGAIQWSNQARSLARERRMDGAKHAHERAATHHDHLAVLHDKLGKAATGRSADLHGEAKALNTFAAKAQRMAAEEIRL